jgi:hypothetical protein
MEKLIKYRKVVLALSLTWWIDITFRLLGRLGEWVGWLSFGLCALLVLLNIILFIGMLARDMVFIVNKYKEIIEHSEELSTEDKESIYSALATAINSYNYWSKIFE